MESIEHSCGLEFEIEGDAAWIKGIGVCKDENLIIPMVTDDNYKVVGIRAFAFDDCKTIISVNIPKSVEVIEEFAFANCSNIKSVKLHYGLKEIWGFAFEHCISLTSIEIPSSVVNIGNTPQDKPITPEEQLLREVFGEKRGCPGNPFKGCTKLRSIRVNSGNAFYHDHINCLIETKTKKVISGCKASILPGDDSCEIIGEYAFWGCQGAFTYGLYAFEEPKIKVIEQHAFAYCADMQEITFPNTVTHIGAHAFEKCTSLSKITFSDSLVEIGWKAFEGCAKLYKVDFPNKLEKIGFEAFKNCTNLTIVNYGDQSVITVIASGTFEGCTSLMNVLIPEKLKELEDYSFKECKNLQCITLPNGLEIIGKGVFESCEHLEDIFIPQSVESIDADAFLNCWAYLELIRCETQIKPENWNPDWNRKREYGTYHKVAWNSIKNSTKTR